MFPNAFENFRSILHCSHGNLHETDNDNDNKHQRPAPQNLMVLFVDFDAAQSFGILSYPIL